MKTFQLLPIEFKRAVNDSGEFSGYASTFAGEPDSYGDIVQAGAFAESLQTHSERGTMPAMLWAHDQSEPIGTWLAIQEDATGLSVRGKLNLEVARGREAHALLKSGALALSIGFAIAPGGASLDDSGARVLTAVTLFEISLVSMPANHLARIGDVKSISLRQFESAARDALNLSRKEAISMAKHLWPELRDEVPTPSMDRELLAQKISTITESLRKSS